MNQSLLLPAPRPVLGRKARILLIVAIVALLAGTAYLIIRLRQPELTTGMYGVQVPVSRAMEEKFGVRIVFAGLTARDGMVDLRYRVVDAGKAKNFGHFTDTAPFIVMEDGTVVEFTKMGLHNHRVEPGIIFHVLYRNTGNAVQHGERVTVQVGDIQLKNVIVQ